MRAILAGLFVYADMLLVVILLGDWLERSPLLCGLVMSVIFLVLCIVAFILFNLLETRKQMVETRKREAEYEQQLREWEAQGLLDVTDYKFMRVFCVEADEDEDEDEDVYADPHYFLELDNGSVLYLTGHYLSETEILDYIEPLDGSGVFNDDAAVTELRESIERDAGELATHDVYMGHYSEDVHLFELTVKRHRSDNRIVQVVCKDMPPVIDRLSSNFWNNPCCQNRVFNDGDIITDCTYDQLLTRL